MWLDRGPDWDEAALLIRRSCRLIAPKRLAAALAGEEEASRRRRGSRV
jgi:hypothetical protein